VLIKLWGNSVPDKTQAGMLADLLCLALLIRCNDGAVRRVLCRCVVWTACACPMLACGGCCRGRGCCFKLVQAGSHAAPAVRICEVLATSGSCCDFGMHSCYQGNGTSCVVHVDIVSYNENRYVG
jgi:hypothetical protein